MKHTVASILVAATILIGPLANAQERLDFGDRWDPLDAKETAALSALLKAGKPKSITIACASFGCAELARGIEKVFAENGWKVTPMHHGGLGIDGVLGIRIDSCGIQAHAMHDALSRVTSRKTVAIDEGSCRPGADDIFMIIGTREN